MIAFDRNGILRRWVTLFGVSGIHSCHFQRLNYEYWVKEILRPAAERGSRESFSDFVLDLPELPPELLELLRDLAAEKNRYGNPFPSGLYTNYGILQHAYCYGDSQTTDRIANTDERRSNDGLIRTDDASLFVSLFPSEMIYLIRDVQPKQQGRALSTLLEDGGRTLNRWQRGSERTPRSHWNDWHLVRMRKPQIVHPPRWVDTYLNVLLSQPTKTRSHSI
jgi:hypothetical protein